MQKNSINQTYGTLFIIPTPIGNIGDITTRALNVINSLKCVFVEDTRMFKQLCNALNVSSSDKEISSYHKFSENHKLDNIIEKLQNGVDVGLLSDAGSPTIADPGFNIVYRCYEAGIKVEVLPGACAAITGLIASGASSEYFAFLGFAPRKEAELEQLLKATILANAKSGFSQLRKRQSFILYEAVHRIEPTLYTVLQFLQTNCLKDSIDTNQKPDIKSFKLIVCRELTKLYEEVIFITNEDDIKNITKKGEFVIVVEIEYNANELNNDNVENSVVNVELVKLVSLLNEAGVSGKAGVKLLTELGVPRNTAYSLLHR